MAEMACNPDCMPGSSKGSLCLGFYDRMMPVFYAPARGKKTGAKQGGRAIRRAGKPYSGAHGLAEKGRMALREIYQKMKYVSKGYEK